MKEGIKRISIPFVTACIIILLFKQDNTLRNFENSVPLFGLIRQYVFIPIVPDTWYKKFLLFYLCDILWAYSLYWAAVMAVRERKKALILAGLTCLFNEFIQLIPRLGATFDWFDILFEFLALGIGDYIYSHSGKATVTVNSQSAGQELLETSFEIAEVQNGKM